MRRGGIQDRISPNEDPITVGTDPEDPVIVKEQLPMPVKPRLRKRHAEKLRRILVQSEETCSKLAEYHKLFIDPGAPYTSEAFLAALIDSYDKTLSDARAILHVLKHNKHVNTVGIIVRAQYNLDVAAEKVAFVEDLHKVMERQRRALARILPIREDKVTKFYISLGYDTA